MSLAARALRACLAILGSLRRATVLVLLVASLALNIATVTSTAVYTAVSGAVGAIGGVTTVLARSTARQAAERQAIRRTTAQVRKRAVRAAARNTASAFGEAVPFAGVAVVAAALALEVRDACHTARDMAVLEAMLDDPEADPEALAAAFDCTSLIPSAADLPDAEDLWAEVRAAPGMAWDAARGYADELSGAAGATSAGDAPERGSPEAGD